MTDREWADKASHENYDRVLRVAYKRACEHHIPDPENWAMDVTQTVFLLFYAQIKEKICAPTPISPAGCSPFCTM